jgi:hypothetical protein
MDPELLAGLQHTEVRQPARRPTGAHERDLEAVHRALILPEMWHRRKDYWI